MTETTEQKVDKICALLLGVKGLKDARLELAMAALRFAKTEGNFVRCHGGWRVRVTLEIPETMDPDGQIAACQSLTHVIGHKDGERVHLFSGIECVGMATRQDVPFNFPG